MTIRELQKEVHSNAINKGFWYAGQLTNIPEKLCLIHSELSEALEDYRINNMESHYNPDGKPVGFPTELADAFIRLLDLAEFLGIDLMNEAVNKHLYNINRPYKHGNKKA